jgi:cleavage and polyadenylation specificity factor subunit 3
LTLAAAGTELVRWALEGTFGTVTVVSDAHAHTNGMANGKEEADEEIDRPQATIFEIMGGAVRLICRADGEVELEWEGNTTNDGIADAVMAVLLTLESSPAAVKQSSKLHSHDHAEMECDPFGGSPVTEKAPNGLNAPPSGMKKNPFANLTPEEKLNRLLMFLEAQFGEDAISPIATPKLTQLNGSAEEEVDAVVQEKAAATELARLHNLGIPVPGLEIKVDKMIAKVWLERLEVECGNKSFADRVKAVVERGVESVAPLWQ